MQSRGKTSWSRSFKKKIGADLGEVGTIEEAKEISDDDEGDNKDEDELGQGTL